MIDYLEYEKPEVSKVDNDEKETIVGEGTVKVQLDTGSTCML